MMSITHKERELLAQFEAELVAVGLDEQLAVARELVAKGAGADEVYLLMRGGFPKSVITALLAERHAKQQPQEPVIR